MDLAIELDHKTYTPSDFCLMGIDMIFDSYCPDEIEKEITTVFKEKYNVDIEYVNTAYTIKNFFDLSQKHNELMKLKMLVEGYCAESKISTDKYQSYIDEGTVLEGFPVWPSALPCGKTPINLREINEQIESLKKEIEEAETIANDGSGDAEIQ